eukprot:1197997-Prymnesium_polylepis.1
MPVQYRAVRGVVGRVRAARPLFHQFAGTWPPGGGRGANRAHNGFTRLMPIDWRRCCTRAWARLLG